MDQQKNLWKILSAGVIKALPIKIIKLKNYFGDGKFISIKPSTLSLDIEFELKYAKKIIGNQKNKLKFMKWFNWCFQLELIVYEDIELIKKGLAKGGNLKNTIFVKKNFHSWRLRNEKEFVNHKILDCIGTYILGCKLSIKCSQEAIFNQSIT